MTSRDFVYWLQGYFEIMDPSGTSNFPLGPLQTECIQRHLALVFKHEIAPPDPPKVKYVPPHHDEKLSSVNPAEWQKLMQATQPISPLQTGYWPDTGNAKFC